MRIGSIFAIIFASIVSFIGVFYTNNQIENNIPNVANVTIIFLIWSPEIYIINKPDINTANIPMDIPLNHNGLFKHTIIDIIVIKIAKKLTTLFLVFMTL